MRGPINRTRDLFGALGDRVVVDGADLARRVGAATRSSLGWIARPFQRVLWPLQERLIWPVQDRLPHPRGAGRVLIGGAAFAVAAGIGVAGVLLLASGGSGVATRTEATVASAPAPKPDPPEPKASPEPTLQGAAPVFKPAQRTEQPRDASPKPEESAPPEPSAAAATGSASSSAATDRISSAPAGASAQASTTVPAPAGPAAIAVAHEFADAFVVYETGGVEPAVRDAFGKTATERLSRALLRRPPRLPANVDVPEAKVLNVVAAPSRGPVYPVSVSLVRLGVTSELRLSMEQRKSDGWRVTDVLG